MTIPSDTHRDAYAAARGDAARVPEARLRAELAEAKSALQAIRRSRTWRMAKSLHGFVDDRPWLRPWLRRGFDLVRSGTRRHPDRRQPIAADDVEAVLASGLFDAAWYTARYPDAPRDPAAAASDYLTHAGARTRDPGPLFDAGWYIATSPEVGDANALLHYLRKGRHRLRCPNPAAQQETEQARRRALGLDLPIQSARLAIGLAGPTTESALARVVRSARLSAERAGLDAGCEILWLAQPGIAAPGDVRAVTAPPDITLGDMTLGDITLGQVTPGQMRPGEMVQGEMVQGEFTQGGMDLAAMSRPAAHNLLLGEAADLGASLYLAADPRGIFEPGCIAALLRMSAAADHTALVAATAFPQENPKAYDTRTFDTGWAGGGCVLIPLALAAEVGGCEPRLTRYWDVDLSWRTRQTGFAVKTCPLALYHMSPDAVFPQDRVDDQALSAGYLLAALWGHQAAFAAIRAEILRRNRSLPSPVIAPRGTRDPAIADFAHGFGFAPSRW
jgi:hypothetical protein